MWLSPTGRVSPAPWKYRLAAGTPSAWNTRATAAARRSDRLAFSVLPPVSSVWPTSRMRLVLSVSTAFFSSSVDVALSLACCLVYEYCAATSRNSASASGVSLSEPDANCLPLSRSVTDRPAAAVSLPAANGVAEAGELVAEAATVPAAGRSPLGTMTEATVMSALCCLAMANSAQRRWSML